MKENEKIFGNFDFSVLNDPDFGEDGVREELTNPILKKLGYRASGIYKINYSKSLNHPFVKVGSGEREIKIIPDYLLEVNSNFAWVLDAKAPKEEILRGEHKEQAYFYAIHPDIRALKLHITILIPIPSTWLALFLLVQTVVET